MVKKMRVAFIQPNTRCIQGTAVPPFGLMYIAAMARKHSYEVKIFDRNLDFFIFSKLKKYKPDIVAISGFTGPGLMDVVNIAKQTKKMFGKSFPVILGGVHASSLPEQTLKHRYIDYIVIGEGDYSFLDLLHALETKSDLSKVKGIGYKEKGKLIINEKRPLIQNLDELPLFPWDLVNYKKYFRFDIILITSRGCPYRCGFCYNSHFNNSSWRGLSAERVIEEIKNIEKLTDNKNLGFHDDNFTADRERVYKVLDYLSPDYNLFIETRANYINDEFLEHFNKFKSVWFFLGVESGSQRILNRMNKGLVVKQITDAFDLMNKYDIKTNASVIIGSPTETRKELNETLRLVKRIKPTRTTINVYTPFPGSPWYDQVVADNLFKPPNTIEGWSKFATEAIMSDLSKTNFSSVSSSYIKALEIKSWLKAIWEMIKTHDIHKIKMRLINYEPFAVPLIDPIDRLICRLK